MEEIYSEEQKICKITKASPETIRFLMGFSKALEVSDYKYMKFETINTRFVRDYIMMSETDHLHRKLQHNIIVKFKV